MCQAFESEQRMMLFQEQNARKRGYEAQKQGIHKADNPELLPWCKRSWNLGYDIAEKNKEIW